VAGDQQQPAAPLHPRRDAGQRHNLDAQTIDAAERLYPEGHPLRRTKIEGKRGLDVHGKPVYLGAFYRSRHVATDGLAINLNLPLC
jgi:hypothetical protein